MQLTSAINIKKYKERREVRHAQRDHKKWVAKKEDKKGLNLEEQKDYEGKKQLFEAAEEDKKRA